MTGARACCVLVLGAHACCVIVTGVHTYSVLSPGARACSALVSCVRICCVLVTGVYVCVCVYVPELVVRGLVGDFRVADTPMSVITAPVNPRAAMGGVSGSNRVLG